MYCKLKGKKGQHNPKLDDAVKKCPKGFSLRIILITTQAIQCQCATECKNCKKGWHCMGFVKL